MCLYTVGLGHEPSWHILLLTLLTATLHVTVSLVGYSLKIHLPTKPLPPCGGGHMRNTQNHWNTESSSVAKVKTQLTPLKPLAEMLLQFIVILEKKGTASQKVPSTVEVHHGLKQGWPLTWKAEREKHQCFLNVKRRKKAHCVLRNECFTGLARMLQGTWQSWVWSPGLE